MSRPRENAIDRFLKKVDKAGSGDCWIWRGSLNNRGYGEFRNDSQKRILAHRWSYSWYIGAVPVRIDILHSCDTPRCVNPDHLRMGTPKENSIDMMIKKRKRTKITREQAEEIRNIYAKGGALQKEIAVIYSITPQYVNLIIKRKTWAY